MLFWEKVAQVYHLFDPALYGLARWISPLSGMTSQRAPPTLTVFNFQESDHERN